MKKVLATLLVFALYVSQAWGAMIIQQFTSGSQPTAFFSSDFEDSGDRAQWTDESGTPDKDHSSSGLSMGGSYVMRLDTTEAASAMWTDKAEAWVVFRWRYEDSAESEEIFSRLQLDGGGTLCYFWFDEPNDELDADPYPGGTTNSGSLTLNADTTYWLMVRYKAGGAGESECEISNWNGSSWDSIGLSTDGSLGTYADKIYFQNDQDSSGAEYQYMDDVHVFDEAYTGNPNTL